MRVAVVGHVEWIEFLRVDHMPAAGEIVHARERWTEPGGGGAAAAVQLAKLAGEADFFTALGDDDLGGKAIAELERLGVRVHAALRAEPTRRGVTHVDADGERTITVIGERLGAYGADDLPWSRLDDADAVYFTAGDEGALKEARRARVVVAASRAQPTLTRAGVHLDAVVGSAADRAESFALDDVDPAPRLGVWTDGERGGAYATATESGRFTAFPPPGPIVDRYGAGDAFAAGLTYALGTGATIEDALALAARCGAAVLTGRGPYSAQLPADQLL